MKITCLAILLAALTTPLIAGSLTPPPGPPSSTMKTLHEVEPRTPIHASDIPLVISSPGSYYFAEDVEVSASVSLTTAAIIIESSFVTIDLNGFALRGSNVSRISGIYSSGPFQDVIIKNGHISGWEEYAIYLAVNGAEVSAMHLVKNFGTAIFLNSGRVMNCIVRDNGIGGIYFQPDNPAANDIGSCLVDQCEVYNHGEAGIVSRRPVTIRNTISSRNASGILLYGPGSTVQNSMCNENFDSGIQIASAGTDCLVLNNQCSGNRESGIVVAARGCRVEGNQVARNRFNGLTVSQRSMIFKNTAFDNVEGNYSIVSEAIFGPIVTTTSTDGSLAPTHPWANFSYHTSTIGN